MDRLGSHLWSDRLSALERGSIGQLGTDQQESLVAIVRAGAG